MIVNRNANYSATSVTADGETVLMNMSAFISEIGNVSFGQNIPDKSVYEANKAIADADFETFKSEVIDSIA